MSPDTLPEGTDSVIDTDVNLSGAIPIDAGAEAEAAADGQDTGTPDVLGGATGSTSTAGAAAAGATTAETLRDARGKAGQKAQDLKGQATDKLRSYAVGGKDKASETIQGFSRTIEDAAAQIDEKVGAQYGDYARQAASTLAGFASKLDEKDVDELFEQARDLVRKSPGVAVGAAAAIGFVLARVAQAGIPPAAGNDATVGPGHGAGTKKG